MAETIGRAVYEVGVDSSDFDRDIDGLEKKSKGRLGKIAKVGALAATGAVGVGVAIAASTKGTIDGLRATEKELRPMIERSRIGAESLQVLAEAARRAGSEDGLEGIVDTSQELQLQLGEIALTGKGRALEALQALGLEAEELQKMEPEEAWRAVVEEIQRIPNIADKAVAAEEIFGGTSEKLAGIVNLTNQEFVELENSVRETSHVLSGDALESVKSFDQELQFIKNDLEAGARATALSLLPALTSVAQWIRETGLPTFNEFKEMALTPLKNFIIETLVPAFQSFYQEHLVPLGTFMWETAIPAFVEFLDNAITPIGNFFTNTLVPIFERLYNNTLVPMGSTIVNDLIPAFTEFWNTSLKPFGEFIESTVSPIINTLFSERLMPLWEVVSNDLIPTFRELWQDILKPMVESALKPLLPVISEMVVIFRDEVWPLFRDFILPMFLDFVENRLKLIKEVYDTIVKPTLTALTELLMSSVIPAVAEIARDVLPLLLDGLNKLATVVLQLAELAMPYFLKGLELIASVLQFITDLFDSFKSDTAEAGATATAFGDTINGIFGPIADFFTNSLIPVMVELAEFAWPLIIEVWEDSLKPTFDELVETMVEVVIPAAEKVLTAMIWVWNQIDVIVVPLIKTIMLVIETVIEQAFALIRFFLNVLQGDWEGAWQSIKDFVGAQLELITALFEVWGITAAFKAIWDGLTDIVTAWVDIIKDAVSGVIDWITDKIDMFLGVVDKIKELIENPVDTVVDTGKSLVGKAFSLLPGVGGGKEMATGGIVMNPLNALIGEAGPEAVIPLDRLDVMLGGAGTGAGITVVFQGDVYGFDDFEDRVEDAVDRSKRRGF